MHGRPACGLFGHGTGRFATYPRGRNRCHCRARGRGGDARFRRFTLLAQVGSTLLRHVLRRRMALRAFARSALDRVHPQDQRERISPDRRGLLRKLDSSAGSNWSFVLLCSPPHYAPSKSGLTTALRGLCYGLARKTTGKVKIRSMAPLSVCRSQLLACGGD